EPELDRAVALRPTAAVAHTVSHAGGRRGRRERRDFHSERARRLTAGANLSRSACARSADGIGDAGRIVVIVPQSAPLNSFEPVVVKSAARRSGVIPPEIAIAVGLRRSRTRSVLVENAVSRTGRR